MSLLSMEKLITEVEKQPCVWNVHHTSYSDKQMKMRAWQKICRVFYPQTEEYSADETNKIAFIQKKWKSVRDYYTKQKKEIQNNVDTLAGIKRKKYVYFDMLQFLETKTERKRVRYENEESTSPGREDPSLEESVDVPEDPLIKTEDIDDYLTDSSPDHGLDLSLQRSVIEKKPEIDEDEMFLLSLLPSIRKLTPLQKMDFKLEVMGSLRRIQFSNSVH